MDPPPPPRLKALPPPLQVVLLLWSTGAGWLQGETITGVDHNLQCVNDYLYTINCTLDIPHPENTSVSSRSYWLTITEIYEEPVYQCLLLNTTQGYFCSVNKLDETPDVNTFTDVEVYSITLCQRRDDGSESCEVLDEEYEPVSHIKPNAPCGLAVDQNSSHLHFTWRSTYEDYRSFTNLMSSLQYQLLLYKAEDKHKAGTYINTDDTHYSVERKFLPDDEYAARVRSSPNMAHYQGQWSDWSSEVLWRMDPAVDDGHIIPRLEDTDELGLPTNALMFEVPLVIGSLCVLVVIILVLYYGPVKMWRQSTFIPTPAPYFHSLYRDYQGDFKSWVVTQENTVDALKAEETLKIDTLVQSVDAQGDESLAVPQKWWTEGSGYRNIPALYTDSSWLSAQGGSGGPLLAWSEPGSPARDSGCWLCSDTSLEREPPWYCNEYCTLSCVQQRLSRAPLEP